MARRAIFIMFRMSTKTAVETDNASRRKQAFFQYNTEFFKVASVVKKDDNNDHILLFFTSSLYGLPMDAQKGSFCIK